MFLNITLALGNQRLVEWAGTVAPAESVTVEAIARRLEEAATSVRQMGDGGQILEAIRRSDECHDYRLQLAGEVRVAI